MRKWYLRQNETGGFGFVNNVEDATHIMVSSKDFSQLQNAYSAQLDKASSETVNITREEYNGYQNALRIIRDRSLQEVKKADFDDNGYQLVSARYQYDKSISTSEKIVRITKNTAYSIKMPLDFIANRIRTDLHDFYNFFSESELNLINESMNPFSYGDYISSIKYYKKNPDYFSRIIRSSDASPYDKRIARNQKAVYDKYGAGLIIDIVSITPQYGLGCYQVTYNATDFI